MKKNKPASKSPRKPPARPAAAPAHAHKHGVDHPEVFHILPDGSVERVKDDCD